MIVSKVKSPLAAAMTAAILSFSVSAPSIANEVKLSTEQTNQMIEQWPKASKKAAHAMMDKYGQPDGVTSSMLVWEDNGPWQRTIVYSDPVDHDFPVPHKDVLEQFISYDVPIDQFDDLARFDGSVIAERTKGVISARCDKEAANFLALNLANQVIEGEKSVEEARQAYGETMKAMMQGETPEMTQEFTFNVQRDFRGNPDEATLSMTEMK